METELHLSALPEITLHPQSEELAAAAEELLPKQRRRARRIATYKRIDMRACPTPKPLDEEQAVLCDISVVGAGMIVKRPMKVGEQFLIHLQSSNTDMLYRVVRCEASFDDCYAVGAEYVCVATFEHENGTDDVKRIQKFILA